MTFHEQQECVYDFPSLARMAKTRVLKSNTDTPAEARVNVFTCCHLDGANSIKTDVIFGLASL